MPWGGHNKGKGKCATWLFAHADFAGDGCLIWPFSRLVDGYGTLGYHGEVRRAHVMMCEIVNGPAPSDDHEAAHNCGKGHEGCVHPRHLAWKTRSENQRDRYVNERKSRKGTPHQRLRPEQVEEIRRLRGVETQQSLADRFGVSRTNIIMIQKGQTWNDKSRPFLSVDDVKAIRAAQGTKPARRIAEEYGVSETRIWRILHGKSYKHVACSSAQRKDE